MCTCGPEKAELAIISFVMATAAQASEMEVVVGLQGNGAWLAKKGMADAITAPAFPPLKDLLEAYLEAGGKLLVCGPCAKSRQIDPENDFLPGASIVNAVVFVKLVTSATSSMVY